MFVCEKVARGHRYLYLVESVREGKRVRQRTIRALGRKDVLHASGELDRLIASLTRHSERAMVLSDMEAGRLACIRIGGPLLFGRLWERLGLGEVVNELVDEPRLRVRARAGGVRQRPAPAVRLGLGPLVREVDGLTMPSPGSTICVCTISIGRWLGWARRLSRRRRAIWRRAA